MDERKIKALMQWVAEQGEYITRLARMPYTDQAHIDLLRSELKATIDVFDLTTVREWSGEEENTSGT